MLTPEEQYSYLLIITMFYGSIILLVVISTILKSLNDYLFLKFKNYKKLPIKSLYNLSLGIVIGFAIGTFFSTFFISLLDLTTSWKLYLN